MSASLQRIYALVLRHIYLWRSSVMRLVDSIYWPAVQMVMWGFMTQYLLPQASFVAQAAGVLLSGLLLWEVVVRGNLSLSIAFLEEIWSRNLGHLFVSPIRSWELAAGIIVASLLRTLLGMIPVSLMAWAFFGYSIYTLGLPLLAFFVILQMFSWSIGLAMSGLVMRVGQSAESFAWAAVFGWAKYRHRPEDNAVFNLQSVDLQRACQHLGCIEGIHRNVSHGQHYSCLYRIGLPGSVI